MNKMLFIHEFMTQKMGYEFMLDEDETLEELLEETYGYYYFKKGDIVVIFAYYSKENFKFGVECKKFFNKFWQMPIVDDVPDDLEKLGNMINYYAEQSWENSTDEFGWGIPFREWLKRITDKKQKSNENSNIRRYSRQRCLESTTRRRFR